MKLSTEEDVKIKIVLPFLKSLGFQEDELFFEKSFKIDLGRFSHIVNTEKQYKNAMGRLDILVKRNDKNLFIVEVKRDSRKISDRDVEQATSYAKALHPVAPFTIITNGNDFNIYDSLTRAQIDRHAFPIKDNYEASISEEAKYETLKYFLGYSKDNLLTFCREQVHDGMRTLLGSKDDPSKKYIPELYTPRKRLQEAFDDYINNEAAPVFAIIGNSGSGKTSSMCHMALELLRNTYPVLFYKASDLSEGLIKTIASDFNWVFSPQYQELQMIKRVEEVIEPNNLIIFIEAIDEWNHSNRVEIINNFVSKIYKRKIKLVLSCKTNRWKDYLSQRGTPTELSELIYIHDKDKKGFNLEEFTPEEFSLALMKYREFYQFNGGFEKKVLEECKRIPFLLRVCFEVAQDHKLKHLTFSCKEFFHKYYENIIDKVGNELIARRTLKGVAESLLNHNCDLINIEIVMKELGLGVNQNITPSLFEYNVLERIYEITTIKLKFYFDKFRDYIIAFHVLEMDKNPRPFDTLQPVGVHKDVTYFFYPLADNNQKATIDKIIRDNAEKYLSFYLKILNDNFNEFKQGFIPHTNGDIGFIGELNLSTGQLIMYGFRPLDGGDERILFIPCDQHFFREFPDACYLHGARILRRRQSTNFFLHVNTEKEVLEYEVAPQFKDIIKYGLLNEKNNTYLLIEKIIALILKYQSKYFGIKDRRNLKKYLPISFEQIEYNLRYEKAYRYYEHKCHLSRSSEALAYIQQHAEIAAKNKLDIGSEIRYLDFERIEKILLDAIHNLREQGINSIDELILPGGDRLSPSGWVWDFYSDERLIKYVLTVYQLFLEEYKKLIETNFWSMKDYFKLYSKMPVKCFITVKRGSEYCWAEFDMCHNKDTKQNEVVMVSGDELILDEDAWKVIYFGEEFDLIQYWFADISNFITGGLNNHLNVNTSVGSTPIRNLVYEQIRSEIKGGLDYLFEKYHVNSE